MAEPPEASHAGHRARLRARFLQGGLQALADYEIVELLLTLGTPRRDCKAAAKEALKRFKTLRGVLEASPAELEEVPGIGPNNSFGIRLMREAAQAYLQQKMAAGPVCGSAREVYDYLYASMRGLRKEVCKVLYLSAQNRLLGVEDLFSGTVNASAVFAREVMAQALRHNATALIFVHNHPSGNPTPSAEDRAVTRELVFAACLMGLRVLDHIVIGDNRYYSFAAEKLIAEYEAGYRRLNISSLP